MQINLEFNKPQKRFIVQQPRESTFIGSRGIGKSFLIAYLIHLIVRTMPRSANVIVGQTYKQILTRTLPSTLNSLDKLGYKYEKDYFIKKKPPAKLRFERPFEPPVDYDHFIIFRNGTGFHLASLDAGGGSTRGLNVDSILADESLLIDKDKFDKEVAATNRGNDRYFGHIPWHHGIFHFSSMPYNRQADWLLKTGDYYQKDGHDFTALRNEVIDLEMEFIKSRSVKNRLELWAQITELKKKIRFYKSKEGVLYTEADIFDNIQNVGIRYIEQQYRDLTDFIFLTEILNKRPQSIEGGFYPTLSRDRHTYKDSYDNSYISTLEYDSEALHANDSRKDLDCVKTQPLRIAVDWGDKLNCMTICQYFKSINELRFLKNIYVKHPKILDDLAKAFCDYYRYQVTKVVYFAYDHTGNTQMANSNITYAEQFANILKKHGWQVHLVSKGSAPTHQFKYLLWGKILKGDNPQLPKISFNINNCYETFVSMEQAPAKEGRKGIEKDKSSERKSIPQEQATHLSDTADIQVTSLFSGLLQSMPGFVGTLY